jgi:hypothetical protein
VFPHDCRYLNDLTNINIAPDTIFDSEFDEQSRDPSEELRMIGGFDGSASEFWKLFRNEAKSHDDARINTLKEGMESALIFVRSYSVRAITDLVC